MTEKEIEKVRNILKKGGSLIMHMNDLERLREAHQAGKAPNIFTGVKVYADTLGTLKEGEIIAAVFDELPHTFKFRDTFNI